MINPEQYGLDILSGKIPAGEYVRLSIARHFEELKRKDTYTIKDADDKDVKLPWDYYFDPEEGLKPVKFFSVLRHWRGEFYDKPFHPEPWQAWVLYVFYGWKRKEGNKRRFKYLYIEVPRKNGKTTFLAACTLYHILVDNENAPEVYYAATKERQARLCLDEARQIGIRTPEVNKRLIIRKYDIEYPKKTGFMRALGSDSDTQDGLNPSMAVIDELHAHKDFGMYDKLNTAFGMRAQPTLMMITTAGANKNNPCFAYRNMCIEILQGIKTQHNLLPIIYTLDEEDDWKSEDSWIKANPSWPIMNQVDFKDDAQAAIQSAHLETNFKTLRLNIWTDAESVWIRDEDWMRCAGETLEPSGICYAGADFAESKDLCSLVLNFPDINGKRHIKSWFWIPEKKVREKEDRVDYWVWKEQGFINVIQGDAIDHQQLAAEVMEILVRYNVLGLTYDKYGIGEAVIQSMINLGYPVSKLSPMKQLTTQYQGPIRKLEEEILLEKINHEGHPVLRWNIANVVLFMDSYGGVKFNKSKVTEKIDGAVALAMSIAEELGADPIDTGQVYFL